LYKEALKSDKYQSKGYNASSEKIFADIAHRPLAASSVRTDEQLTAAAANDEAN